MPHLDCPCFCFFSAARLITRTVLPAASRPIMSLGGAAGLVSRSINFFISFSRALTSDCKNRCLRCCSIRRSPMALFRQSCFLQI